MILKKEPAMGVEGALNSSYARAKYQKKRRLRREGERKLFELFIATQKE